MRNKLTRILASLLIWALCFSGVQIYNADEEKRVVKVGVYEMEGFHFYDEYGDLSGYCIDYLDVVASITGWTYEYVDVKDFSDGCQKLSAHEIDLIAPAMMTDARKEIYNYSELEFGTEYTVLVTDADRDDLYYEDFEGFGNMKVAVLNNYPLTEYYMSYMETHGYQSELVFFDSIAESKAAMEAGQVDAIVTSIMDMSDDQKLLARFSPQPFYFLTWKGNTDLLAELNKAMNQVQNTYPTLLDELLIAYYPIYETQFFSREESEYIASQTETLRVAYVDNNMPLSFTNKDGEFDGISREIFDKISEISGLKFEYVALPAGSITYEYLLEEQIDLITGVEYNRVNLNSNGILLSSPYLSTKKVIVSNSIFEYEESETYKVGVVSGSQTFKTVLTSKYPNFEVADYETNEDSFAALFKGEVDLVILNQYVAEAMLSKSTYEYFNVVSLDGLEEELCFSTVVSLYGMDAMSEAESGILISILNKAISQLDENEINNIILSECLDNQYEQTITDFLYTYRFTIGLGVAGLIVFCVVLIAYLKNKRRRQAQRERDARRNALQQKRYKTILECSDDMIYEISLDGESSVGSDKIKEKFGWEIPREVDDLDMAKAMHILHVHPDDEEAFRKTILARGDGQFDELTVRIGKVDGSYLWCKISRTLLMDENHNVVSILGKIVDVDDEIRERKNLELKTRTDGLTGLLNKATFEKEVRDFVDKNSTEGSCFIFLDMDHFKDINDTFGHSVGDQVIKDNAKKIQLLFANFDLVGRFGGDEFCIFVKEIPRDTLIDKLKFAVKKMEQEYPYEGGVVKLSASIGAAYCKREKISFKEFLDVADNAAYTAKDNGRNCYILKDIE